MLMYVRLNSIFYLSIFSTFYHSKIRMPTTASSLKLLNKFYSPCSPCRVFLYFFFVLFLFSSFWWLLRNCVAILCTVRRTVTLNRSGKVVSRGKNLFTIYAVTFATGFWYWYTGMGARILTLKIHKVGVFNLSEITFYLKLGNALWWYCLKSL